MKQQIINILQEIRPEFDFSQDINFIEEGMLDSFDIISLVNDVEEKFNVIIDGMSILPENFSSVAKIANLVSKSKKRQ